MSSYMISSSDGEESDAEIVLNPITDDDLPRRVRVSTGEAFGMTAHRLAILGRRRRKHRRVLFAFLF
jgi:phospho-N-acetylmuramoyl-pentapeptide-transferase